MTKSEAAQQTDIALKEKKRGKDEKEKRLIDIPSQSIKSSRQSDSQTKPAKPAQSNQLTLILRRCNRSVFCELKHNRNKVEKRSTKEKGEERA